MDEKNQPINQAPVAPVLPEEKDKVPTTSVYPNPNQDESTPPSTVSQMPSIKVTPPQEPVGGEKEGVDKEESSLPAETTPPAPKRKLPLKPILLIFGIIVIAFLGFFLFKTFFTGEKKTSEIEITWWGLWEDEQIYKPLINEYESKTPGVKIKYTKQAQTDYRERLTNALAKGSGPDIFRFHNSWTVMFAKELDNVPASVLSAADFAQSYYPTISSDMASGTGIVGIPLGYDALTLFINEDIFNNEGVEPPTTWVELREAAKLLTKTENGIITQAGVALGRTENVDHWPEIIGLMMLQNGVNMAKPEGKLAEDALVFYSLFSKVDGVWDETLPPSTAAFASGKLAMYFAPSWRSFNIKEQNPNINFRTVSLPQLPKEDPNEPDVAYATYWADGVWARSKNKEKAWDFVKFLIKKESLENVYKQASAARGFGEAYPRVDMGNSLLEHPVLGSVIKMAPDAQSWFLADRTFDGQTGINSQLKKYFEDAINAVGEGIPPEKAMEPLTMGVGQVLGQYGLVK